MVNIIDASTASEYEKYAEMDIAVKVNRKQFDVILPFLFAIGFKWINDSKDTTYPSTKDQIYLFIRANGNVTYCDYESDALYHMHEFDMQVEPTEYLNLLKFWTNQYLENVIEELIFE